MMPPLSISSVVRFFLQLLIWALIYPLAFLFIHIALRILSIPAVLLATKREVTTSVKYYNKEVRTLKRFKLPYYFSWLDTPDNPTDEYFYNLMYRDSIFSSLHSLTVEEFNSNRKAQILCMRIWLQRNCGYGFSESVLGIKNSTILGYLSLGVEDSGKWFQLTVRKTSFQLEMQFPLFAGRYNSTNIGWKPHKDSNILAYAGRVVGIKRY